MTQVMPDGPFVRVDLVNNRNDEPIGRAWGICHDGSLFLPLHAEDWGKVSKEFGVEAPGLLNDHEIDTVVPAEDDPETPDEAWVALAKWRLTK